MRGGIFVVPTADGRDVIETFAATTARLGTRASGRSGGASGSGGFFLGLERRENRSLVFSRTRLRIRAGGRRMTCSPVAIARVTWTVGILLGCAASGCAMGTRNPSPPRLYGARLVGSGDTPLRGALRDGQSSFVGVVGRDYGIEVSNRSSLEVGVTIAVDGLDSKTGAVVSSCGEAAGGYGVRAQSRVIVRGFPLSARQVATYRFAPPATSLASKVPEGRPEAIGTVEVCFYSLRPRLSPSDGQGRFFEVSAVAASRPTEVTGVIRVEPEQEEVETKPSAYEMDKVVESIVVRYEDEAGSRLGTAPPPVVAPPADRPSVTEPPPLPPTGVETEELHGSKDHGKPTKPKTSKPPPKRRPTKPDPKG